MIIVFRGNVGIDIVVKTAVRNSSWPLQVNVQPSAIDTFFNVQRKQYLREMGCCIKYKIIYLYKGVAAVRAEMSI